MFIIIIYYLKIYMIILFHICTKLKYIIFSQTNLNSKLIEESKLSILNKENEDIKTNG